MKLKQIVKGGGNLTLTKEKKVIPHGEVFEVNDKDRAKEILNATYQGQPVAELIQEETKQVKKTNKK